MMEDGEDANLEDDGDDVSDDVSDDEEQEEVQDYDHSSNTSSSPTIGMCTRVHQEGLGSCPKYCVIHVHSFIANL